MRASCSIEVCMKMTVELKRSSSPHVILSSPVHMAALPHSELFFNAKKGE